MASVPFVFKVYLVNYIVMDGQSLMIFDHGVPVIQREVEMDRLIKN